MGDQRQIAGYRATRVYHQARLAESFFSRLYARLAHYLLFLSHIRQGRVSPALSFNSCSDLFDALAVQVFVVIAFVNHVAAIQLEFDDLVGE
jgi:hypothetical protein